MASFDKAAVMSWRSRAKMGMMRGGMGGLRPVPAGPNLTHRVPGDPLVLKYC